MCSAWQGHALMPEAGDDRRGGGAIGGPVNCEIELAESAQHMHVVRVDVDTSRRGARIIQSLAAAAARRVARLPHDGASWSVARRQTSADEFEPVDPIAARRSFVRQSVRAGQLVSRILPDRGSERPARREQPVARVRSVAVVRRPSVPAAAAADRARRHGDHEHRGRAARRRVRAIGVSRIVPRKSGCFTGARAGGELQIVAGGKYRLGPATTAASPTSPAASARSSAARHSAIRAQYTGPIKYTLDPGARQSVVGRRRRRDDRRSISVRSST